MANEENDEQAKPAASPKAAGSTPAPVGDQSGGESGKSGSKGALALVLGAAVIVVWLLVPMAKSWLEGRTQAAKPKEVQLYEKVVECMGKAATAKDTAELERSIGTGIGKASNNEKHTVELANLSDKARQLFIEKCGSLPGLAAVEARAVGHLVLREGRDAVTEPVKVTVGAREKYFTTVDGEVEIHFDPRDCDEGGTQCRVRLHPTSKFTLADDATTFSPEELKHQDLAVERKDGGVKLELEVSGERQERFEVRIVNAQPGKLWVQSYLDSNGELKKCSPNDEHADCRKKRADDGFASFRRRGALKSLEVDVKYDGQDDWERITADDASDLSGGLIRLRTGSERPVAVAGASRPCGTEGRSSWLEGRLRSFQGWRKGGLRTVKASLTAGGVKITSGASALEVQELGSHLGKQVPANTPRPCKPAPIEAVVQVSVQ